MYRIALALVLTLAACAPERASAPGFRDTAVPMFSNAVFDPARLPGQWVQAAAFSDAGAGCTRGGAGIEPGGATTLRLCLDGRVVAAQGRLVPVGPGRFALQGDAGPLAQTWWVVWVDTDYRTLAIGTPSGDWGFILNRGGPLPDDRLRAAAEIFDFNGYDTARLARTR
jgi:apolipoprotein D and lipocalin family protein